MWLLAWILNRLFKCEQINGHGRCQTYLYRWRLFRWRGAAIYVHRFVGDDWSLDYHDHPKRFITAMFYGSYIEDTPTSSREYSAPWIRSFPATHTHRIRLGRHSECWTLVIVWFGVRPWGFWHAGKWIHWLEYVRGKSSHIADARATCQGIES